MSELENAFRILKALTEKFPPGEGQEHTISLSDTGIRMTIMAGDVYFPLAIDRFVLDRDPEDVADQALEIAASDMDVAFMRAFSIERQLRAATDGRTGIELITAERSRQLATTEDGGEGFGAEHDDQHINDELPRAALCYLVHEFNASFAPSVHFHYWPWAQECWKPTVPVRDLTKAGALIAAEIDRLSRIELKKQLAEAKQAEA